MGLGDSEIDARSYGGTRPPVVRFDAIGEAWDLLKQQWGVWAVTTLVVILINGAVSGVVSSTFGIHPPGGFGGFRWPFPRGGTAVYVIVSAVINGFFVGGMFRMACRQVRGERIAIEDLFGVVDVIGELMIGSALYTGAVMAVSLVCFFLPGLIVHGLLMFTLPLIVDARMTGPAAIAASWNALKANWLKATLFHFVVSLLSGIGFCLCCVGLLFTAPLYTLSIAVLYRDAFLARGVSSRDKPVSPLTDF